MIRPRGKIVKCGLVLSSQAHAPTSVGRLSLRVSVREQFFRLYHIATFTDEEAEAKYHVKNGDILVGMDGDFHMCIWASGHAFQNQRVAKFESNGAIGNYHLFLALELPIQTWNKSIVGTTVAHLGDMHIKTIQIAWPPENILAKAKESLEPMSQQIIASKRQIKNLRRTRDLLLPRLLTGQIDVEAA